MGNNMDYILLILCAVLSMFGSHGKILDVTGFNMQPILQAADSTFFGGYKSGADIDAAIILGRDIDTGTGPDWPPYPIGHRLMEGALGGRTTRIRLPASIGIQRIGAFYINTTRKADGLSNRIITITMSADAGVYPESQTKTVYVGETVTLKMTHVSQNPMALLEWRFNSKIMGRGSAMVHMPGVTKADEGIYECYEIGQRMQGRQGIMRLIVKECRPGWWGPPACNKECDVCFNGGVCDSLSGHCVCTPGFGSKNCEVVYGRNRWGNDGALTCSGSQDEHGYACQGRLFCLPDPYGCSCIAGFKGLDCMTECDQGTYGAGCKQRCHCEGMSCLLDSGECAPGVQCLPQWTGINCQVPVPCPAGYYGDYCTQRCRCKNRWPCNQQNGFCDGGCQTGYIGDECNQDGSPKLVSFASFEKVNSGHTTVLICSVTGNPAPTAAMVTVADSNDNVIELSDSQKYNRLYKRDNFYRVEVNASGEVFTCNMTLSSGDVSQKSFTVDVYTPPVLTSAPTIESTTSNSVTIKWSPWTPSMGGDGPIVKYIVAYREHHPDRTMVPFTHSVDVMDVRALSKVITGLHWHTEYDFVVSAVRDGPMGEGPHSPIVQATTRCDTPTASPNITSVYAVNSSALAITWKLPPRDTWCCQRVQDVLFRWKESNATLFNDYVYAMPSDDMTIISGLKPCVVYDIKAKLFNVLYLDGPFSAVASGTTGIAVPAPVSNLTASGLTFNPRQIRVTWQLPTSNACPVDGYQVTYHKVESIACRNLIFLARNITVPSAKVVFDIRHLEPYSRYRIAVSALNIEGEGRETGIIEETTSDAPTVAPITRLIPPGETTSLHFSWYPADCRKLNGPFKSYKYQLLDQHGNVTRSKQVKERRYMYNVTFNELTPCTEYYFRVKVSTDKGYGPYSEMLKGTTEVDLPGTVTNLQIPANHVTSTSLIVSWIESTEPPCLMDIYRVQLTLLEQDHCAIPRNGLELAPIETRHTSYRADWLSPNSMYSVMVTSRTMVGYGEGVSAIAITEQDAPSSAPSNIARTTNQKRSLRFEWDPPPCGTRNGNITKYGYKLVDPIRSTGVFDVILAGTRHVDIADLIPYVEYHFQVRAYTIVGAGPYSDVIMARTAEAKPGIPLDITTPSADSQLISLQWYPPDPPQGNITVYHITYWPSMSGSQTNRTIKWTNVMSRVPYVFDINGLESQTQYSIVAETSIGRGPATIPITRVTEEGYPSIPLNLAIASRNETQLSITWEPPKTPNGNIVKYRIMYRVIERPYDRTLPQTTSFQSIDTKPIPNMVTLYNLEPSAKYEVQIAALTRFWMGDFATFSDYTSPSTDIDAPAGSPNVDESMVFPGTMVAIKLIPTTSKYVIAYYILVEKKTSISKRAVPDSKDSYITAEIDKDNIENSFMVGDNRTYGGYHNSPLQKGTTYNIRQGAVSKAGNQVYVECGPPLQYTAGASNGMNSNADIVSVVVGVVVGVAMVIVVSILAVVFILRRRRENEVRKRKSDEFNSIPLHNLLVKKSSIDENSRPRPSLKVINSEPSMRPRMRRPDSEDALANLVVRKNGASQKASVRRIYINMQYGPIRVDRLADYIKEKKAETKDGLKQEYLTLPEGKLHPWTAAMRVENKQKNRYGNIIAYDHSRVMLTPLEGIPHSDYINACYIDGYRKGDAYIACQGPNIASMNDIWRMAWQEKSPKIIMVTNLNEGGKKKCEKYWPDNCRMYGDVQVTKEREENYTEYCTRTFTMQKNREHRQITQFHFLFWPDMGVPSYTAPLIRFIRVAKAFNPPKAGPTIVHCSAGVGRTGTLITVDAMLDMAKQENQIDVYNFVQSMRERRIKMVQTPEQYVFIYDTLLEALICGDTSCLTEAFCAEFRRLKTKKSLKGKTLMQKQFEALELVSIKLSPQTCRGGSDPLNVKKNRYTDRLPFDKFRPYLMTEAGEDCTNYVNASFLDGYIRKNMFFATQMPLPNTVIDFWRLLFDYNSNTIVMLNPMDYNDATMSQYWPETGSVQYGPFTVELISSDTSTDIITRTFYLTNSQRKMETVRKIRQFQYTGWPTGQATPHKPDTIVQLYSLVERWCPQTSEDSPITVHCLDGMGVTGTFCAIFMVLDRLKTEQSIDVFQAVKKLRVTRAGMVQSVEQYRFCYQTVLAYLDSMELYGNFIL